MKKVTENDFEKVRKFVTIVSDTSPYPTERYLARSQAYQEALPAATFLVEYYFTHVKPDNGVRSLQGSGPRPYNTTEKERAIIAINNGFDVWGNNGENFLKKYPTLLEEAIIHYKMTAKKRLETALKEPLSTMRGEQFLLLLQEYDRWKVDGNPLVMDSTEGISETKLTYKDPYQLVSDAKKQVKDDLDKNGPYGESSTIA